MTEAARLLDGLRARCGTSTRLEIDDVRAVFVEVFRGTTGSPEARGELGALLEALAEQGLLTLPRGKAHWDHTIAPPLPRWIRVARHTSAQTNAVDHRTIAWPPELAFVASMRRVPLLDDLLQIRSFLAGGGRERPLVPLRERSLEIFGDEKRLDALRKSALFTAGHLDLHLLRCREVAPPLVWERRRGPEPGGTVLVIVNLHTYDSFRRWNARVRAYTAVAYGHGHEFKRTCLDLPRLCARLRAPTIEYFGDLDSAGLEIPHYADQVVERAAELRIEPAVRWYEALLSFENRACEGAEAHATAIGLQWLPAQLRERVATLLAARRRLPQEFVGEEFLAAVADQSEPGMPCGAGPGRPAREE